MKHSIRTSCLFLRSGLFHLVAAMRLIIRPFFTHFANLTLSTLNPFIFFSFLFFSFLFFSLFYLSSLFLSVISYLALLPVSPPSLRLRPSIDPAALFLSLALNMERLIIVSIVTMKGRSLTRIPRSSDTMTSILSSIPT